MPCFHARTSNGLSHFIGRHYRRVYAFSRQVADLWAAKRERVGVRGGGREAAVFADGIDLDGLILLQP